MQNKNLIKSVKKNSIAKSLGLESGDFLLTVNDKEIIDYLDYKFEISDEYIELEILKKNGQVEIYEIEKDENDDLGIVFEEELIDKPKRCQNKCIFCFMDQLPKKVRPTLVFKDDDYRLSFFTGNYVTLTNCSEEEIKRIIRYHLSPINISVHATDTKVRETMLNNKKAGNILKYIKMLRTGGIEINAQIVLCKGINDGEILEKTIKDLIEFNPLSISIVPVGLTKYREGLFKLELFKKQDYRNVIAQIEKYQKNKVYLSDEFYLAGEVELPSYEYYDEFPQIENGVGLTREFLHNFKKQKIANKNVSIACGKLIYPIIKDCFPDVKVYPITNYFFGENITVTGLITGSDLIKNLKGKDLGNKLYICDIMLKDDEEIFLDDLKIKDVEKELEIEVSTNWREIWSKKELKK